MIFQEKQLRSYNWDNIFNFRVYMQEYLKSINHIHEPKHCPNTDQAEELSLSENSGYYYNTIPEPAPRIKELKARQDDLSNARVQTEADMVLDGIQHIDVETVKSYAQDLRSLLEESDFTQSKSFLRSFVKKVIINGGTAKIQYRLPMPPDGEKMQSVGVLPIVTLGGAEGIRTPIHVDDFLG